MLDGSVSGQRLLDSGRLEDLRARKIPGGCGKKSPAEGDGVTTKNLVDDIKGSGDHEGSRSLSGSLLVEEILFPVYRWYAGHRAILYGLSVSMDEE